MKKATFTILLLLIYSTMFSQKKNYFVNLEVELSKLNSNTQKNNIVNRERDKFNSTHDSLYYMTSRYAELYTFKDENRFKTLPILFELIKINNNKYASLTIGCNFGIAQQLEHIAPDISLECLNRAIEAEESLNKDKHLLPHLLHFKGRLFYNAKDYKSAITFYNKALAMHKKRNEILFVSSMYNNISMIYEDKKDFNTAIKYSDISIAILERKKHLNNEEYDFSMLVKNNKARYFSKQRKIIESEKIYDEVITHYKKNNQYNSLAFNYRDLTKLYDINSYKYRNLINDIVNLEQKDIKLSYKIELLEVLQEYYIYKQNYKALKINSKKLNEYNSKYITEIIDNYNKTFLFYNKTTEELYDRSFKTNYTNQKKRTNIIIYSLVAILLFLLFSIFLFLSRRKKEKEIFSIKTRFLEQEKIINEQEIEIQKEKLKNLSFFLEVKNKVENSFLNEIKKLKKSKTDQNDVLDNLRISYHNLTEINKNFETINYNNNQEYKEIKTKIAERHPSLSTNELQYCVYFSKKLSSKEIAIIENITPASVRVFKNRIKNKLNLDANTNLEDYLSEI